MGRARAPPGKPYGTLCIGRSSGWLLCPPPPVQPLPAHLLSLPPPSSRSTRGPLRRITPPLRPDLFTGVNIYPMLIVFRAEHAACLKHSSLFKVKSNWFLGTSPPLSVGTRGQGVFPPGELTPKLSEELAVSTQDLIFFFGLLFGIFPCLAPSPVGTSTSAPLPPSKEGGGRGERWSFHE